MSVCTRESVCASHKKDQLRQPIPELVVPLFQLVIPLSARLLQLCAAQMKKGKCADAWLNVVSRAYACVIGCSLSSITACEEAEQ